jgi:DNA-binding CsgD family transcriptional regulator
MGFDGVRAAGRAALAVRDLAEGDYEQAYHRLKPLVDDPFLQVTPLELPDFVEAACRSDRADEATAHVHELEAMASVNGSPWTAGVAHRSRALVEEDAEPHHRAAVDALASGDLPIELARAHLLYGEWLRRSRRRRDARDQLHAALELFEHGQAPAFAHRTRAELSAIGGQPAPAGVRDALDLTAQQLTVARLAAAGRTNSEIGATMFLSPNTVDYHLRNVFHKLGISSRRQLSERLDRAD